MKKFILSIVIGSIGGSVLALGVLFVTPRLPHIFAYSFFYPQTRSPITIVQDIKKIFQPDTEQYFILSIDESLSTTTKTVYADLGAMHILLYENGEKINEYPIQSIGREGTPWQTPLGLFDMNYKKENHFSSIGSVWMPYSMHFFGNYFIHGWPYYSSGMPVSEGYSGGCIRLNTDDAKELYGFVDKNTDLIITTNKKPEVQKEFQYQIAKREPELLSSYIVVDIQTGEVVASKDANISKPADSFTKIMNALISLETLNQYQEAVFNQDIVKISDVLYAVLLDDSDEAAQVLSEHKNKSQYLIDMNTRAESLGMSQTIYKDAIGSNEQTVSSLEDMFKLLHYIHLYKPFMITVLSLDTYSFAQTKLEYTNPLSEDSSYVAGFSSEDSSEIISLVTHDIQSPKTNTLEQKTFLIIVRSEGDSTQDTQTLHSWLKENVSLREY